MGVLLLQDDASLRAVRFHVPAQFLVERLPDRIEASPQLETAANFQNQGPGWLQAHQRRDFPRPARKEDEFPVLYFRQVNRDP